MKTIILFILVLFVIVIASSCKRRCDKPDFYIIEDSSGDMYITIGSTYGSTIYWTVTDDGSTPFKPNSASNVYTKPIDVSKYKKHLTIKAQAHKEGWIDSRIATGKFIGEAAFKKTNAVIPIDTLSHGDRPESPLE